MTKIAWEMTEQFYFPEQLGLIEEIVSLQVKPQWESKQVDDSLRLTGIYHIAAKLRFAGTNHETPLKGIFIDQLDATREGNYFEYALPLDVDLPKDKILLDDVTLQVLETNYDHNGVSCEFKWQVVCQYDELQPEPLVEVEYDQPLLLAEETEGITSVPEDLVEVNVTQDDFYAELAEAYSLFNVTLNKVNK